VNGSCPNRWRFTPHKPVVSRESSEGSSSPLSSILFSSSYDLRNCWNILISFLEGPFFFFFSFVEEDEAIDLLSEDNLSSATFFSSGGGRK
jgi:hypothetical protein